MSSNEPKGNLVAIKKRKTCANSPPEEGEPIKIDPKIGKESQSGRFRGWVGTWNNYPDDWESTFEKCQGEASFYVVGQEIGEEKHTPHLQFWIEFKEKQSFKQMKGYFPKAWLAARKGTPDEAYNYCTKDEVFTEWGKRPAQGKRNDFIEIRDAIREDPTYDVMEHAPAMIARYPKFVEMLIDQSLGERNWQMEVYWFHGPPGSGKTREAYDEAKRLGPVYSKTASNQWWNGYVGQENVIIDDWREGNWPFGELLRVLDRYPHQVQKKGSAIQLVAKRIWITCPDRPENVCGGEDALQLIRRITKIVKFEMETSSSDQLCDQLKKKRETRTRVQSKT